MRACSTTPRRTALTTALLLPALLLTGCVTETRQVRDPVPLGEDGQPLAVQVVPQQMQDLSGDLLRYNARFHRLPPSLPTLVDSGFADTDADLSGYVYHPDGLCVLDDGRAVLLADNAVRLEGHLWCIVKEPGGQANSITFNVTPIAIDELEAAIKRAQ